MIRTGSAATEARARLARSITGSGSGTRSRSSRPSRRHVRVPAVAARVQGRPWKRWSERQRRSRRVPGPGRGRTRSPGTSRTMGSTMQFFRTGAGYAHASRRTRDCAADPASCLRVLRLSARRAPRVRPPRGSYQPRVAPPATSSRASSTSITASSLLVAAWVNVNNARRLMFSLGTDDQPPTTGCSPRLNTAAAAQGIDLASDAGTTVRVRWRASEYKLSLLNGLQIDPSDGRYRRRRSWPVLRCRQA